MPPDKKWSNSTAGAVRVEKSAGDASAVFTQYFFKQMLNKTMFDLETEYNINYSTAKGNVTEYNFRNGAV